MPKRALLAARTAADVAVLAAAYFSAYFLRFEGHIPFEQMRRFWITLAYVVGLQVFIMASMSLGRHSWRYYSLRQAASLGRALAGASVVLVIARLIGQFTDLFLSLVLLIPFSVIAMDLVLAFVGLLAIRAGRRLWSEGAEARAVAPAEGSREVVLIGAGRAGAMVARELAARPDLGLVPIGFLDDDQRKIGDFIMDLQVLGPIEALPALVADGAVDEAIITIAAADGATIRRITEVCESAGLTPKIIPGVYEIVGGTVDISRVRPVAIEDLLGREAVDLDLSGIRSVVEGRAVVVTGAGGSIGSEICRQLLRFDPSHVVLVERAEPALWAVHRELTAKPSVSEVVPVVADVRDAERILELLTRFRPAVVFHAAAHKHVPMMEWNPGEAIKNNVFGTETIVAAAVDADIDRFVMVSTDKAVNPTSVMGATKRIAERHVQAVAARTGRRYTSVRFGNVLGSAGSVIPIFKEQIAAGGPVTVTHPDMLRYFMTIPEAAQLVVQTAVLGEGGEVFVLAMGEPVRILDLARDLIRLSGFEPDTDVSIEFTGLRPGEKLFEEMNLSEENADPTRHRKIWVGRSIPPDPDVVEAALAGLGQLLDTAHPEEVRREVLRTVAVLDAAHEPSTPEIA